MSYPKGYEWLGTVGVLPKTIQAALAEYGTLETPGRASNQKILGWAKELGLDKVYSDDSIPWCGLFAAIVARRAGKAVVQDPLWARNWAKFGLEVLTNGKSFAGRKASLGDVLVYVRDGGGHVNFYLCETATHYIGIGGNQSDSVSITSILKSRCIAVRRPTYNVMPDSVKPRKAGGTIPASGGSEA